MLILVRPHVSLLDGPAVAARLPRMGLVQTVPRKNRDQVHPSPDTPQEPPYGGRHGDHKE
ncbi:hypothetical protein [Acidithiobacillus ferrooxidans]|uniref:hypothetical protein n=1 Tax=Acidithiobacillus ferrooxidans TaxID=920 RepID=UPI0011B5DE67|nr:hypothetical protein [Acidithiobacillus ferrooxidans]MCR1341732.1 hypothetical protein [Acidithiobacillus ferrooxidans]QZT53829.1 hypothetical protein K7B00_06635 [Acidithiobacillus ferrooxidans]BDB14014.1 hypothetical protein ANFP_13340 [Acidithiobacillus ferrooxidans]